MDHSDRQISVDQDSRSVSSSAFAHKPPYIESFKERVPLVQVFRMTLASHLAQNLGDRASDATDPAPERRQLFAAECGVYKGHSLVACAKIAKEFGACVTFYGLDTFSGLPNLSSEDEQYAPERAKYRRLRLFADTTRAEVSELLSKEQLEDNVLLLEGRFSETLPNLIERQYFFVNIDCDLYEGHLECLEYFYPRMVSGGVIFVDDYHSVEYPMARAAIDKFMADKAERLFHLRYGTEAPNHTKAFMIKF
jgi:O-methyltransferase